LPRRLPTLRRKRFLAIARRQMKRIRLDPNLQQMHTVRWRIVHLTVTNPTPRGHGLQFSRSQIAIAARAVSMVQPPVEHPSENLHVVMAMLTKTTSRLDNVIIDHAKRAIAHIVRIVIPSKRKRMPPVEPPDFRAASVFGPANCDVLSCGCHG